MNVAADNRDCRQYQLRVQGHLDPCWADWFGGMVLIRQGDGTTTLQGPVADQAALHGVIAKVRDIGATLISVNPLDTAGPRTGFKGAGPAQPQQ